MALRQYSGGPRAVSEPVARPDPPRRLGNAPSPRPTRKAWPLAAAAALVGLGLWGRCAGFRTVFPAPGQVELVPADSHYYVRFALLQLHSFPRFTPFDPFVNFPTGAKILWPPLHALAVAAAVALGGTASPERGAAFVGPILSAAGLSLLALLAFRLLGGVRALGVVALLALTPVAVSSGALGNADHHVHEPLVIAAAALALGHALETRSRRSAALAGAVLGLGRLLTPMAFAFVPLLALTVPLAAWIRRREGAEVAARGLACGVTCAGVLAAGVLLLGEARSLDYEFLSWFHPLLALAAFVGGAGLAWALAGSTRWRLALPAATLLALPIAPQLWRALRHLGRVDPLLSVVTESRPLLADPTWALELLGAVGLALPLAALGALRRLSRDRALEALPALVASVFLALAAALQARFAQALAGSAAVLLPLGLPFVLPEGAGRGLKRLGGALLALGGLTLLPRPTPAPAEPPVKDVARVRPTLRWMRDHTPPASDDPLSPQPPRYGVAASYLLGHFLNLWAERPSIASTFSQAEAHLAGNLRAGQVLAATDDGEAFERARATGARYVLATPSEVVLGFPHFDRERSLLTHLLDHAGMAAAGKPATSHFRLVFDSAEQRLRQEGGPYARLFEVVPGAVISGAARPGAEVAARLKLVTRDGAALDYERRATTGATGRFELRVAYPTEGTAEVRPAPGQLGYEVVMEGEPLTVPVLETQVEQGQRIELHALGKSPL